MIDLFERKNDETGGYAYKSFYGFFASIILLILFQPLRDWSGPTPYGMMVNLTWGIIWAAWVYYAYRVVLYFLAFFAFRHEKVLFKKDKPL